MWLLFLPKNSKKIIILISSKQPGTLRVALCIKFDFKKENENICFSLMLNLSSFSLTSFGLTDFYWYSVFMKISCI